MNSFERLVRAVVIQTLRDTGLAPSAAQIAGTLKASEPDISSALHSLAERHRLALVPGTDKVWMAHPFSGVKTDFVVSIGKRRWFANCVWDGLSILALLGDGNLDTHSPATGAPIQFRVSDGHVFGEALVHLLVPARRFWDDIGFT
ncbi:MAG: alkylmercury lyase family protein [Desulfobacterota bacterium]|jgi:hypothetical protein|nr:alkylmercury lyase family protein [Thermodesulfobacteriota bacterium]